MSAPEASTRLRAEQVDQLYGRFPAMAVITLVSATLLAAVQWSAIEPTRVLGWWGGMMLITTARWLLVSRFRRVPRPVADVDSWERRFLIGVACAGLAWGAAAFLLFPEQGLLHQTFVLFVLMGLSAASITSLSASWRVTFAFLSAVLGLLMLRFFLLGGMMHLAMSGALLLYFIVMAASAWRTHQTIREALILRADNLQQQGRLLDSEEALRHANRLLNQERNMFVDGPVIIFKWRNAQGWPVDYVSPNVKDVLGYSAEELLSGTVPYEGIIPAEDIQRVAEEVKVNSARGAERFEHLPYRIIRKDGRTIWVADYTTILRDAAGTITHYLGYVVDITERIQAEEALRGAKEAAEEANRTKSQFLANMSHEIRTPMSSVMGLTDLLLRTALTPVQREYAETIQHSADSLLTLLNDILDVSRIEAGRLDFEHLDFDPRTTVEAVIDALTAPARRKDLELTRRIAPAVPSRLRGDPGRLRQILTNLISNAVKFTREGGVTVRVDLDHEEESAAVIRFAVADTGPGIPADRSADLFEVFTQRDASTTRISGGAGLGLAISRQLCELMGGRIGVESEEGKGSTFWFTVPFERSPHRDTDEPRDAAAAADTGVPAVPDKRRQTARILVVEDNPINQTVAIELLQQIGYRADLVTNGLEAIQAFELSHYDLVLMDVQMPEMDGFEATRRIRLLQDSQESRTPIIAMTAYAMKGDRERCLAAGMDGYVSKPVHSGALEEILARWITGPADAPQDRSA